MTVLNHPGIVAYKKHRDEVRQAVWDKTNGLCWYCGRQTDTGITAETKGEALKSKFSVDHFTPLKRGGTDDIDNLVPACWSCNTSKHKREIEEWREMLRWKEIGKFTKRHIEWLRSHGIELPEPPVVTFYFESLR